MTGPVSTSATNPQVAAPPGASAFAPTFAAVDGPFGVEVCGVDAGNIASTYAALRRAFLEHHLVVLRDVDLDAPHFQALAEHFGPLETSYVMRRTNGEVSTAVHFIQNLDHNGQVVANPYGNANYFWHTDKQYHAQPSLLTMLQAIELPPAGGDTEFADLCAAWEALPAAMQRRIEGLRAVYSYEHMLRTCLKREATDEERAKAPPMIHPLVRTHAETGRKSLFLGMYCGAIVGMPDAAARELIDELHAHALQPRFIYTHHWRPGDLLFWDNRCLLHRAIANYEIGQYRRVLRRVVVRGEVPV